MATRCSYRHSEPTSCHPKLNKLITEKARSGVVKIHSTSRRNLFCVSCSMKTEFVKSGKRVLLALCFMYAFSIYVRPGL